MEKKKSKEKKVFISNYPFARSSQKALEALSEAGIEYALNSKDRKLTSQEIRNLARECDALMAGTEDVGLLLDDPGKLKLISRVGIGLDAIPLQRCKDKGIRVAYTPDAVTQSVAELTIGQMIMLSRQVQRADREVRKGSWERPFGKTLRESTIGIIGFGRIGHALAKHLVSFNAKVLVNDIVNIDQKLSELRKQGLNILEAPKEEIYKKSDIISVHVPLTEITRGMISKNEMRGMKKNVALLNQSRGGIINEKDLLRMLTNNPEMQAAIDVFEEEPYKGPLLKLDNILITQHMGACSYECRLEMEMTSVDSVIRFFEGLELINEVPQQEYDIQAMRPDK